MEDKKKSPKVKPVDKSDAKANPTHKAADELVKGYAKVFIFKSAANPN